MDIAYESEDFPLGGPVTNGNARLQASWDDILWAALTVGRPNRAAVFQHGDASLYEAVFRLSLVRMAVEQAGPKATRLRRTRAARTLDPSEKGAVNYFVGMTMCKMFADRVLSAPWMLHLDVFRPQLDPVLTGRSRPDLIGQRSTGDWLALESKGRISAPDAKAKSNAKQQAQRCVSINGAVVKFHIGAVTYLRSDVLEFYWRDPEPNNEVGINVVLSPDVWQHHYRLPVALNQAGHDLMNGTVDLTVDVYPSVLRLLLEKKWADAKAWCETEASTLAKEGYRPDGLLVRAGQSWKHSYQEVQG